MLRCIAFLGYYIVCWWRVTIMVVPVKTWSYLSSSVNQDYLYSILELFGPTMTRNILFYSLSYNIWNIHVPNYSLSGIALWWLRCIMTISWLNNICHYKLLRMQFNLDTTCFATWMIGLKFHTLPILYQLFTFVEGYFQNLIYLFCIFKCANFQTVYLSLANKRNVPASPSMGRLSSF